MLKVCIVDELHKSFQRYFEDERIIYSYFPYWKASQILREIQKYDGVILRSKIKIDEQFISKANNLKFVARVGSGTDGINKSLLKKAGIALLTAPEGNRNAVAEHTIGMMLAILNNFKKSHQQLSEDIWDREGNRGTEISSKTVGVIGYGNVGKLLSKKLNALGAKVLAYDKRPKEADKNASLVSLKELQQQADIVSLHIPLDDGNYHFADEEFFSAFQKSIFFFNTSRGEVVKTSALIDALNNQKVIGAGIDVLENEKIQTLTTEQREEFDALRGMYNVLITPHVAGWSYESYEELNKVLGQKIKAYLDEVITN